MISFFTRKCSLLAFLFFLIIGSISLSAQTKTYSLKALVEAAKNYLPSLLQKQALINSAEAAIADIRNSFLPKLTVGDQVSLGTDNSMAGSYLPVSIVPSVSAGVRGENLYQPVTGNIFIFYGEYELLNFGLHKAKIKNASSYVDLEKADLDRDLYYLKLQICQLYFNLLKNQYRLNADQQNVDRYQNISIVIHALTLSGINSGVDSSLADAELSSAKVSYNRTRSTISQLREQLAFLTGIVSSQLNIDTLKNNTKIDPSILPDISSDTINNPLITYYARQKDVFLSFEKVINKSYLPRVLLGVSGFARGSGIQYDDNYKSFGTGLGYQRFNYVTGIGVTYDLFNNLHRRNRLDVYRYQTKASDYALQQQKLALFSASNQADSAIKITESNLAELPVQMNAAQNVYQQKIAQYKAGLVTLIDLTNASFVLYRSQTDFIEVLNDWYLAKLDKASATGHIDLFIQSIQ